MAGYTVKNVKDLEDQAAKFGLAPDLEARFAQDHLDAEQIGMSYQRLAPDTSMPFAHHHETHEEVYVVVSGSGTARLDSDVVEIRAWDAIRVAPATVRSFTAGPDGLEYLAVGPKGTGDAVQLPPE